MSEPVILTFLGRNPDGVIGDQGITRWIKRVPAFTAGFYYPHNDGRFVFVSEAGIFHVEPFPYNEDKRLSWEEVAAAVGYTGPMERSDDDDDLFSMFSMCNKQLWALAQKKIESGEWTGDAMNGVFARSNNWPDMTEEGLHMFSYWGYTGKDQVTPRPDGVVSEDGNILPFGIYDEALIGAVLVAGLLPWNA